MTGAGGGGKGCLTYTAATTSWRPREIIAEVYQRWSVADDGELYAFGWSYMISNRRTDYLYRLGHASSVEEATEKAHAEVREVIAELEKVLA